MNLADLSAEHSWMEDDLLERFLRYVKVFTTSNRHADATPTTPGQWDLARILKDELAALGISDLSLDEKCFLIARIPANVGPAGSGGKGVPTIGFMAHVDTAQDLTGEHVKPRVIRDYDGKAIRLNDEHALDPEDFPALREYEGKTIITTSGDTLLGADDKAGVAEIMTAVALLQKHPEIPHGEIEIIFTPDEETGKGMDRFPRASIRSTYCYTLDGGDEGSVEAECFTAYKAEVEFHGRVIHLGDARGKLANAVTMAAHYVAMLPRSESPEATDGRYGYYCPIEIRGDLDHASVEVYLRDFDAAEMKRRIGYLKSLAETVAAAFPGGRIEVAEKKQYLNMFEELRHHPKVIEHLDEAIRATGMEPNRHVIRGGTDGARLTELGIPTPNVFAGGHNMHSRYEWVALPSMVRAAQTIVNLVQLWTQGD